MPTENRSSNTEMVSVKRELVEQAMQACFEAGFGIPHDALRDVLAKPDQQHQGEPVAMPAEKELVRAWGHDMGGNYDEGKAFGWNACLDEIAKLGPLYTHADPGEVERLRAVIDKQKSLIASLRAELVESYSINASAAPSTPVEIDERAEFELAYQRAADCGWTSTKMLSRRIWDARAALERKP